MFSIIGHVDTLLNYYKDQDYDFNKINKNFQVDLPRLKKGNVGVVIFAIFVDSKYKPYFALERTIQLIDKFYDTIESTKEIDLAKNYSEINYLNSENKIAAILGLEGAEGIFDLSALRMFYRLGLRIVSLTWNQRNQFADGIGEYGANGGLTHSGKELIKEMNSLGIIVDLSHLAPKSFWDIIEITESPVVATHSNVKTICNHPRNLSDEQIKAIAESGGLVGINFCPEFIKDKGITEIKDIIKHINYIRELVGIEHIGLGTDYDGISNTPNGLEDVSKIPKLVEALFNEGYNTSDIKKILQANWLRLFKEVLKN